MYHLRTYLTSAPAQEELIQELNIQISRLTPVLKEGRTSTLLFLTREAADEEKRILEEQLRQKDSIVKDKDTRIAALNEQCASRRPHVFTIDSRSRLQWRRHKRT
jgi:hypothetical protein